MAALEYFNGSSWVTLSNVSPTTLTGAVTGSGTGSIATSLNTVQTVSGSGNFQYFNFNASSSLFQLTNLFSSAGGTTAYNTFTILTDTKDFNFKHTLPQAASTSFYDNGTFSLNTHNNITSVASTIFSTFYDYSIASYTSLFSTSLSVTQFMSIGSNSTSALAQLYVFGGTENITGEESCIRVRSNTIAAKIEIENIGGVGRLYELRSNSDGSFSIADRTTGNARLIIDTLGNIGLGTSPFPVKAKIDIVGGVQNVVDEDSCIRVISYSNAAKIELRSMYGFGNLYELRSNSDGSFSIFDRTTGNLRLSIDNTGNLSASRIYGRRSSALITINSNSVGTNIAFANQFPKIEGIYTYTHLTTDFTTTGPLAANGRIIYIGSYQIYANIKIDINASHNGTSADLMSFAIMKSGAIINNSIVFVNTAGTGQNSSISLNTIIPMVANDYIEVLCSLNVGGRIVTVKNLLWNISTT